MGEPDGPVKKRDRTRAAILEAAKRLFIERGYGATSMRDIAHASGGRAPGGIYNHFPTKQAIFQALMEEGNPYPHIVDALRRTEGRTAAEFIGHMLRRVVPFMLENFDFVSLIQIDAREFGGEHLSRLFNSETLPTVFESILRLKALPGLKDHDPIVLVRIFASTVIGYIATRRLAPTPLLDGRSEDAWLDIYLDTLLFGLVPRE